MKALWQQGVLPYFLRDYLLAPLRKARWRRLARDGGVLRTQIEPGVKLKLPGNDGVAGLIYAYHYEVGEREFIRRYLQVGDTFVDAGAHIGLFTLIAAHKVGPAGKVIAFEPCATSFEVLRANIALNDLGNVQCEDMALSDCEGTALFHSHLGEGRAAFSSLSTVPAFQDGCAESVLTTTLDRYMDASGIDTIALVKLDVEGWRRKFC